MPEIDLANLKRYVCPRYLTCPQFDTCTGDVPDDIECALGPKPAHDIDRFEGLNVDVEVKINSVFSRQCISLHFVGQCGKIVSTNINSGHNLICTKENNGMYRWHFPECLTVVENKGFNPEDIISKAFGGR